MTLSSVVSAESSDIDIATDGLTVTGLEGNSGFGASPSFGSSVDGPTLWVAAPGADDGAGVVWALSTAELNSTGTVTVGEIGRKGLLGEEGDFIGTSMVADQDIDGDGIDDLFVASYGRSSLFGVSGGAAVDLSANDVDWIMDHVGGRVLLPGRIGDVDGDGSTDLVVSAVDAANDEVATGVFAGSTSFAGGSFDEATLLRFIGFTHTQPVVEMDSGDRALTVVQYQASVFLNPTTGSTLDPLNDADFNLFRTAEQSAFEETGGYGWMGVLGPAFPIGAPTADEGSERGECAIWQTNELSADGFSADLQALLVGEAAGDRACDALWLGDDYNGDGDPDLLIGAPLHDGASPDSGVAYLQFSP